MQDDNRVHDRSAKRCLVMIAVALIVAVVAVIYVSGHRTDAPTPPGGDLAPIPAAGGRAPDGNML